MDPGAPGTTILTVNGGSSSVRLALYVRAIGAIGGAIGVRREYPLSSRDDLK
jgi:hypothetical protein